MPIALQPPLFDSFKLVLLALRQQGFVVRARNFSKHSGCRVPRSSRALPFVKTSKTPQTIHVCIIKVFCDVLAEGRLREPIVTQLPKACVHAVVRITLSQEKWPTQGRPSPLPQRYTQRKTEAVQPPDDRTYSAEVTVFQRNLLHHRSAQRRLRLHALEYSNTPGTVCQ